MPDNSKVKVTPGPRSYWPLGTLRGFQQDPIRTLLAARREFGDVVRFRVAIWFSYLLAHPDHVKHVLQDNNQNYQKGFFYQALKPVVGEGLLTSEGEFWRRQRRIAQPAFHRQRLATLASIITEETASMLEGWKHHVSRGEPRDVLSDLMSLTLEIVSRTLFGSDVSGETGVVAEAVTVLREHVNYREMHIFTPPERFPTPRNLRFGKALRTVDRIVYEMIRKRRQGDDGRADLLSMLLGARDEETGESMTDKQLRDETMTIFLAGHETTANALAWTLHLLSQHPEAERTLHEEVVSVLDDRAPTVEDLPNLRYARMVIEEALRLYPPVWAIARQALEDDEVDGYRIPANSTIILSPYVTHRHPEFWEEPERFEPERFLPGRSADRPRYAYFPFGGGPRQCIGNEFAMMETQLVLVMIAREFSLGLPREHSVELEPSVTLRPKNGLPMSLVRRA